MEKQTRTLQHRVEELRQAKFLGVPIDNFERGGREQLIFLLMNGLAPDSKVLDIGCGVLRAGYWLIHFLDAGCYFGIEPSAERLAIGLQAILEPHVRETKRPRFDANTTFDTSVFHETFDYYLAYSVWTHAPKQQIAVMLDNFVRDASDDGVFLATFLPAHWRHADYDGDQRVGTSQESDAPGCIHHSFRWIRSECRRRGLSLRLLGRDTTHGQTWLRISRADSSPRFSDLSLRSPSSYWLYRVARGIKRLVRRRSPEA